MANVQIIEAVEVTPELVAAFERLIPQLSSSNPAPTETELAAICESEASVLLIAVDRDADHQAIHQRHRALDDIDMAKRNRVKGARIKADAHGVPLSRNSGYPRNIIANVSARPKSAGRATTKVAVRSP
mgnify:CR=1 FL=1